MLSPVPAHQPEARALRQLVTQRIKASGWARFARLGAGLVCVICVAAMLVVRADGRGDLGAIAGRALGWASWLVALPLTLGAITGLAAMLQDQQLVRTLRALGFGRAQMEASALRACIRMVLVRLSIPGVGAFVIALVLSRGWEEVPVRALQLAAGVAYASALACAASVAALAACRLGAKRGRWMLLLFLLGPMLVSDRFLRLVNLPRVLGHILDGIVQIGAA